MSHTCSYTNFSLSLKNSTFSSSDDTLEADKGSGDEADEEEEEVNSYWPAIFSTMCDDVIVTSQ